jgi:hypothetical protein
MLVPVDHSRMELLANFLTRCAEAENFYSDQDIAWTGLPGSQAQAEHSFQGSDPANPWPSSVMNTTYTYGRLLLTSMAEQALGVARLITEPTIAIHGILPVEVCLKCAPDQH